MTSNDDLHFFLPEMSSALLHRESKQFESVRLTSWLKWWLEVASSIKVHRAQTRPSLTAAHTGALRLDLPS